MFLAKGNIQTIWDVLYEEKTPLLNQQKFIENINIFGEREKSSGLTLFQLNTKFIMHFKDYSDKQFKIHQQQQQQQHNQQKHLQQNKPVSNYHNINEPIRLNIEESNQNYSITAEELHAERIDEFDKQLSQKQNEFNSMMILEKPLELNFSDIKDKPIGSEMEQLIANTMKQRNFDIEQIHNQNINVDTNWLKGKETSLKSEKVQSSPIQSSPIQSSPIQSSPIQSESKHISWSSELTNEEPIYRENIDNIFSKLKQVKVDSEPSLKEINDKLDKIIKHLNIL